MGKRYALNGLLCILWGLMLALGIVWRTFVPSAVLPGVDIPMLMTVSLGSLLLERWLVPKPVRDWPAMGVLAAVTFGLLPLCGGMTGGGEALKLAAAGGGVFLICCGLFDSMAQRIGSGKAFMAAHAVHAFLLFLAGQGFANIIF